MIADLHCDLLCYLNGDSERTPYDPAVRCSILQLNEGCVSLQVLPIFVSTHPGSAEHGLKQARIFAELAYRYPEDFNVFDSNIPLSVGKTALLLAVENASSFCEEDEPLDRGLKRFEELLSYGKPVYISLTWNHENRFGGGAHSTVGLKADGRRLLENLNGRRIAIDLSHASDALGYDIFEYIDKMQLDLPVIASHSNFRAIADASRNLPEELAAEILKREGIVGLNFIRSFVGTESTKNFVKHLEYILRLGGKNQVCFGADFFYENDVPLSFRKPPQELFFPGFDNSASYGRVLELWRQDLGLSAEMLQQVSFANLHRFLIERIL